MSESDVDRIKRVGDWNPPGRTGRWRFGMLLAALLSAALGLALLKWPWLLIWVISGACFCVALLFGLSALLARGGGAPAPVDLAQPFDTADPS